jgi:hypothetical protein
MTNPCGAPTSTPKLHGKPCGQAANNCYIPAHVEWRASSTTLGETSSAVAHPKHYNVGRIEVIDAIEAWSLGFNLGNVVKYVARADHKAAPVEDLKKACWYLMREIERREKA